MPYHEESSLTIDYIFQFLEAGKQNARLGRVSLTMLSLHDDTFGLKVEKERTCNNKALRMRTIQLEDGFTLSQQYETKDIRPCRCGHVALSTQSLQQTLRFNV